MPVPANKNTTVLDAYFARLENGSYTKVKWTGIEDEIYVIVKTIGLVGKTIELNILDKEGIIVERKYDILPLLQDNKDKKGKFSTTQNTIYLETRGRSSGKG